MTSDYIGKFIDFIITQDCTFRCPYCSQSKVQLKEYSNANDETIQSFYRLLDKLDKDYEITLLGGEAMMHPNFYLILENVIRRGFKINLITNGSFSFDKYKQAFDIAHNHLKYFDISFHLDQIKKFEDYINKIRMLINYKPDDTVVRFFIPIYMLNSDKKTKISTIKELAKKYDIKLQFQHIRILNKYIEYSDCEKEYFKNETYVKSRCNLCYAGAKSAIIYENGKCYRCYSSRFIKSNFIGNINDKDFKLNSNPLPCFSKYCTCPKPFEYNQILNKKSYLNYFALGIVNLLFLPLLVINNKKIIIQKLKQKLIKTN